MSNNHAGPQSARIAKSKPTPVSQSGSEVHDRQTDTAGNCQENAFLTISYSAIKGVLPQK